MKFYSNFPEICLWPTKFRLKYFRFKVFTCLLSIIVSCSIPKNKYKLSIESIYFLVFQSRVWAGGGKCFRLIISPLRYIKASPVPVFRQIQEIFSSSEIWPEHSFYFQQFSLFPWQHCGIPSPPWVALADCGISRSSLHPAPGLFYTANTVRESCLISDFTELF